MPTACMTPHCATREDCASVPPICVSRAMTSMVVRCSTILPPWKRSQATLAIRTGFTPSPSANLIVFDNVPYVIDTGYHLVVAGHKFTSRDDIEKYLAWRAADLTLSDKGMDANHIPLLLRVAADGDRS